MITRRLSELVSGGRAAAEGGTLRQPASAETRSATARPAASSRDVMMTLAPAPASTRTVSTPMPLLPPMGRMGRR